MKFYFYRNRSIVLLVAAAITLFLLLLYWSSAEDKYNKSAFSNLAKLKKSLNIKETPDENLCRKINYEFGLTKVGELFFDALKPSWTCPEKFLSRTGKPDDGGKWTCGLDTLAKQRHILENNSTEPCLVYSFGVNDDSSFEAEVLTTTPCSVYAYDPSVSSIAKPLRSTNPRVHFEQLGIDGIDSMDRRTLAMIMKENGHENRTLAILKLDVEGWEYPSLDSILQDFPDDLPFDQLLVEFHIDMLYKEPDKRVKIVSFINQLYKRGLCLFHFEPNKCSKFSACREFSFVNVNAIKLYIEEKKDDFIETY